MSQLRIESFMRIVKAVGRLEERIDNLRETQERLESENRRLREALNMIQDSRWWRWENNLLVWRGESPDGNEIIPTNPRRIAYAALHPEDSNG